MCIHYPLVLKSETSESISVSFSQSHQKTVLGKVICVK